MKEQFAERNEIGRSISGANPDLGVREIEQYFGYI